MCFLAREAVEWGDVEGAAGPFSLAMMRKSQGCEFQALSFLFWETVQRRAVEVEAEFLSLMKTRRSPRS